MIAKAPPSNKGRKLPPEPLSRAELAALLRACEIETKTATRHQALIVLLWRGMVRCDEALALRPCDVDLATGAIHVLHGKGDQDGVAVMDPQACAVVRRWLDDRAKLPALTPASPLICTKHGTPLAASYVRALLPRLAKRAGIAKRVHAHGMRHTGAFELVTEGVDVVLISEQLRHKDLSTTYRYLRHHSPQARFDAIGARRW